MVLVTAVVRGMFAGVRKAGGRTGVAITTLSGVLHRSYGEMQFGCVGLQGEQFNAPIVRSVQAN